MKIRCTHCGADVPLSEATTFVKCPYCHAALVAQIDGSREHRIMTPSLNEESVLAGLRHRLADEEVATPPEIERTVLEYHPFWSLSTGPGQSIRIAAASAGPEAMARIRCPDGNAPFFSEDSQIHGTVLAPEIPVDEALATAFHMGIPASGTERIHLLHVPFHRISYRCRGAHLTAWVDACTGTVYGDNWPASTQRARSTLFAGAAMATFSLFALQAWLLHPLWLLLSYPASGLLIYIAMSAVLRHPGDRAS